MRMPTHVRWMTESEWNIVTGVYTADRLPYRQRIFVTNGLGAFEAPFTIPTSLITGAGFTLSGVIGGPALVAIRAAVASAASIINAGYLMNVGSGYDLGDDGNGMASGDRRLLLVHETAHVWQGKNSVFALSYVYSSALAQCRGLSSSGDRGRAYDGEPGQAWGSYNAEQQAQLIERWYKNGRNEGNDPIWPYIRDYVRRGRVS